MNNIYIHKGDSTIFANVKKFLTFTIDTNLDLTGWTAQFILGFITKDIADISLKSFEVILSAEETNQLRYGAQHGSVILKDSEGNVKTVVNTIPFIVSDAVVENEYQEIDLTIPENSGIDILLKVGSNATGAVSSVNGQIGDVVLTAQDVGALSDTIIVPDISDLATKEELEGKQDKGDYALSSDLVNYIDFTAFEEARNDYVKRGITENDIHLTKAEQASAKTWLGLDVLTDNPLEIYDGQITPLVGMISGDTGVYSPTLTGGYAIKKDQYGNGNGIYNTKYTAGGAYNMGVFNQGYILQNYNFGDIVRICAPAWTQYEGGHGILFGTYKDNLFVPVVYLEYNGQAKYTDGSVPTWNGVAYTPTTVNTPPMTTATTTSSFEQGTICAQIVKNSAGSFEIYTGMNANFHQYLYSKSSFVSDAVNSITHFMVLPIKGNYKNGSVGSATAPYTKLGRFASTETLRSILANGAFETWAAEQTNLFNSEVTDFTAIKVNYDTNALSVNSSGQLTINKNQTYDELNTTNKTIIGAINELYSLLQG